MDAEKYTNEANRHIFDKSNWMSSQEDSTLQLSNLVNGAIDRFIKENLLFNKLAEGLKSVNPKNPVSLFTHNTSRKTNDKLSYPVITFEISRFADHHLQPLVRKISSYNNQTKLIIFLFHLTRYLLQWISNHYAQVFLITKGFLQ